MKVEFDLVDLLWSTLRGIDASTDARRRAPTVLRLEQQIARALAELDGASAEVIVLQRAAVEPDDAA